MASDRLGLIIIRTWIDLGSSEPLRAEVRVITDVAAGVSRRLTFSRPELVCAAVEKWLIDFASEAERPD